MSQNDPARDRINEQAEVLWLGRAINAPEAWRTRAASAAGLLAAAAAAIVVGLIVRQPPPTGASQILGISAAVAFSLSVMASLIAITRPTPSAPVKETHNYADDVWAALAEEAGAIRYWVRLGTWLAAGAILATGVTLISLGLEEQGIQEGWVLLQEDTVLDELGRRCDDSDLPLPAAIRIEASDRIRVSLEEPCGEIQSLELDASEVIFMGRQP